MDISTLSSGPAVSNNKQCLHEMKYSQTRFNPELNLTKLKNIMQKKFQVTDTVLLYHFVTNQLSGNTEDRIYIV